MIFRLKHFQAYHEYIKGNEEKAMRLLENALVHSAKCENVLELVHINHSKLVKNCFGIELNSLIIHFRLGVVI